MSAHYETHAQSVVKAFLEMLEPEVKDSIKQEHLDELAMMMESAISTAVLEQLEGVADEIGNLSNQVRRRAERYESAGNT